jgi:hypothetical protein
MVQVYSFPFCVNTVAVPQMVVRTETTVVMAILLVSLVTLVVMVEFWARTIPATTVRRSIEVFMFDYWYGRLGNNIRSNSLCTPIQRASRYKALIK